MKALVIAGIGIAPGKTTVAAGLAQAWLGKGRSVGYLKVSPNASGISSLAEADTEFLAAALGIQARVGWNGSVLSEAQAFSGSNVLLVELSGDMHDPQAHEQLGHLTQAFDASLLLVAGYRQRLELGVASAVAQEAPGRWVGLLVNGVPESPLASKGVSAAMTSLESGIVDLGRLPESRALLGFCIGDLAEYLEASFLGGSHLKDGLIEHLVVGANAADPTGSFFKPRSAAAVFCRVDRPDIQLVALNHPVRCLVLTGKGHPQTSVLNLAEDAGVAMLRVNAPTIPTIERLDGLVNAVRFRQRAKLPVIRDLVEQRLSLQPLEEALGIA